MKTLKFLFGILLGFMLLTSVDVKSQTTHEYVFFSPEPYEPTLEAEQNDIISIDIYRGDNYNFFNFKGELKIKDNNEDILYKYDISGNYFHFNEYFLIYLEDYDLSNGLTISIIEGGSDLEIFELTVTQKPTLSYNSFEKEVQVNVYPNPFVDNINIDGFVETWDLYDFSGRLISSDAPNSENINIQLDFVKPGTYILIINRQKKVTIVKS